MASIYRNGIKFTGSNYEVADDKLDATSPRPVQNKVVTEKLTSSINTYVVTTDKNGAFKIGNLNKYLASKIDDISITDNYGYAEFDTITVTEATFPDFSSVPQIQILFLQGTLIMLQFIM